QALKVLAGHRVVLEPPNLLVEEGGHRRVEGGKLGEEVVQRRRGLEDRRGGAGQGLPHQPLLLTVGEDHVHRGGVLSLPPPAARPAPPVRPPPAPVPRSTRRTSPAPGWPSPAGRWSSVRPPGGVPGRGGRRCSRPPAPRAGRCGHGGSRAGPRRRPAPGSG